MSVYSMTGYASVHSDAAAEGLSRTASPPRIGLELRSVNARFLDLTLRLPDELRVHETALRERLIQRIRRGKVELRVQLDAGETALVADPSPKLLQRLGAVQDAVRAWLPDAAPLAVAEVLRLAGHGTETRADLAEPLLALTDQALEQLLAARAREGQRLAAMLHGHVAQLRSLVGQARPLVPALVQQQRERFLERWREAMALAAGDTAPDAAQDRALTEATAFAIRIDVAEELTRLSAHLDEIERLLTRGGEVGKRLDFLIQELHREANTLGSKSAALEMTRIAMDMKVLIEQMREQVQNLE